MRRPNRFSASPAAVVCTACSLLLSFCQTVVSTDDNTKLAESLKKSRRRVKQDSEMQEIRKEYWKRTFDDIRNLAGQFPGANDTTAAGSGNLLSQWKLYLSDSLESVQSSKMEDRSKRQTRRFEGFVSWDRLLQDWADDIQDYIDRAQAEPNRDLYPLSTFGQPSNRSSIEIKEYLIAQKMQEKANGADQSQPAAGAVLADSEPTLPVPAPAKPGEAVLPHTDISDKSKRLLVVTTASLPWRTGTAVNPLLRAAYLTRGRSNAGGSVTLMLPWLERAVDQQEIYGDSNRFASPEEQEDFLRTWLRDSAGMPEASKELKIQWYTAWQNKVENSIYSMGDITALIDGDDVDICILEEPEHLNWYRAPGESWTKKFQHVVGILHTNYFQYALDQPAALVRAPGMRLLCSWMCRAHCHRVIKLSGTLGSVAPEKELVENVHGVRNTFIEVGENLRQTLNSRAGATDPVFGPTAEPTVYFIGKLLWSKGLGSLMELLKFAEETADLFVKVDMYGGGPDKDEAEARASKLELDMPFLGPIDHAELADTHKIFVNPSTSEVLCTTSAEALAMGKFVILPSHPSNDFFAQFPNCLVYSTKEEFVGNLYYALTHSPEPLSEEYAFALSWEAATQRLEAAGCISVEEAERTQQALNSSEASIEIALPSLVDGEEQRQAVATTIRYSRRLFRQFRSKLSTEIEQSKVLPLPLRKKLVSELDKRLDLDIDEILTSPKMKLKLSPAELDKSLLDLYNAISEGPGGDLMRVIGGGGAVGMQNLYMRRQALKQSKRLGAPPDLFLPIRANVDEETAASDRTKTQWVRWAMQKNIPSGGKMAPEARTASSAPETGQKQLNMCSMSTRVARTARYRSLAAIRSHSFVTPPRRSPPFSLLI